MAIKLGYFSAPCGQIIDQRMGFNVFIGKTMCQFSFETKFAQFG